MKHLSMVAATLLAGTILVGTTAASYAEEIVVKLWARADRSGPLRAGNIVAAAEPLNAALKAAGIDKTVKVEVFEGPATGYDADALDILKAFAVNQGRTSTSPRTNGSASSPSPATPWTSRSSSRRTRGPSPT